MVVRRTNDQGTVTVGGNAAASDANDTTQATRPSSLPLLPCTSAPGPQQQAAVNHNVSSQLAAPEAKRRGRRRTLPLMTSSERARYYRRKYAQETDTLDAATLQLRQQVVYLEIRLCVHRQLLQKAVAPLALRRIVDFTHRFVSEQLQSRRHGLRHQHHETDRVEVWGDATAPIVRVFSVVRGRLTTRKVHEMYPFVLGNTIVLDKLIHEEIEYACSYVFYFSADGTLVRENLHVDSITGLQRLFQNLSIVARVVSDVDVHAGVPEAARASAMPAKSRRH
jgi:hypothetical protein